MDETVAQNSQIKWTVYYEEEFSKNPSVEEIRDDLNYLRKVGLDALNCLLSYAYYWCSLNRIFHSLSMAVVCLASCLGSHQWKAGDFCLQ